jgi:predicted phage terminase large subunit-like protein
LHTLTAYQTKLRDFWTNCEDSQVIAAARTLCRTDLYFLLRYGLNRADAENEWIYQRCVEVQENPDGYLDLWSREHYKSAIVTYAKTIQDILASHGDEPLPEWGGREITVGIFSHTRGIAKRFLRQIKTEFESNGKLKEWFPDILHENPSKTAVKWSEDDGIVVKRKSNPAEATVEAWGVVDGQPIGKHFFVLVYDDVVVPESVTTPDMMAKTSDMLALSFALGAEGGRRRFIGTRYHQNDAYRTVIDRGTAKPRIHLLTDDGTATGNPVLRSRQWVEDKRRDMGPYIFACQMLQNPLADETQGFKEAWLKYHDGFRRDGLNVYIVIDPAGSKGKKSDYTAGWVLGLGADQNIYVLDMIRDRMSLSQRGALVMRWHRKYKPMRDTGVRYEKYGMMGDIEHLETLMRDQNYRFDVTEVAGQIPKNDRIKRLVPYFERGRVILPRTLYYTNYEGKTQDLVQDFIEQEYKAFPVPVHDDMLDALARIAEPDMPLIWPETYTYSAAELEPPVFEDS